MSVIPLPGECNTPALNQHNVYNFGKFRQGTDVKSGKTDVTDRNYRNHEILYKFSAVNTLVT